MKRVILVGKAWEIRWLLNQYGRRFRYVKDLIDFNDGIYTKGKKLSERKHPYYNKDKKRKDG